MPLEAGFDQQVLAVGLQARRIDEVGQLHGADRRGRGLSGELHLHRAVGADRDALRALRES